MGPGRGDGAVATLPAVDPGPIPFPEAGWQPAGPDFLRAVRDAARAAGRAAGPRSAFDRVLLDGPAGKVVGTDGAALFAHGGFAWDDAPAAAVPAVRVWAAGFWTRAGDPAVAFAADAVGVRAGDWTVVLPVDRAARYPRYGEVLVRLRTPAARIVLSEADAAAWAARLSQWARADPGVDPVALALADPPTLARPDETGNRLTADSSAFLGRRAVRATTATGPLARALALGFRTLTAVGAGHPLGALDGPRRFVWATLDPAPPGPARAIRADPPTTQRT